MEGNRAFMITGKWFIFALVSLGLMQQGCSNPLLALEQRTLLYSECNVMYYKCDPQHEKVYIFFSDPGSLLTGTAGSFSGNRIVVTYSVVSKSSANLVQFGPVGNVDFRYGDLLVTEDRMRRRGCGSGEKLLAYYHVGATFLEPVEIPYKGVLTKEEMARMYRVHHSFVHMER